MSWNKRCSDQGATLVEVLVALVIGVIVLLALAVPYASESSFWNVGNRQAEAQRDADVVLRSISKIARQCNSFTPGGSAGDVTITFVPPTGPSVCFEGGASYPTVLNGGQFHWKTGSCTSPTSTVTLIDGVASKVTNFSATTIVSNKLVKINLTILNKNQQTEIMEKQIFLRNG